MAERLVAVDGAELWVAERGTGRPAILCNPDWPARQLAGLLPHARFALIEGAEHHIDLTRPEGLRDRLRSFLREFAREI